MTSKIKRLGVLTSGGDAPGMNAVIRAVVRTSASLGIDCIGIQRGYHGLLNGDMIHLGPKDVQGITNRGGTILYTARSEVFKTPEGAKRGADVARFMGLDAVITIGGDGTFRGALALSREGIAVMGVPGTIDNDIACTEYTVGYDTACNTAIECIDKLRDTMRSHERCSIVEVMGREAGHLALYVGVASGATSILVPEKPVDFEQDIVERIRLGRLNGRTHFEIIVAEGAGSAMDIAKRVEKETGIETRVTVLGHIQRGGAPLVRDRVMGTRMGYTAVQLLAAGKKNQVVAYKGNKCVGIDIEEALTMKKGLDSETYKLLDTLLSGV